MKPSSINNTMFKPNTVAVAVGLALSQMLLSYSNMAMAQTESGSAAQRGELNGIPLNRANSNVNATGRQDPKNSFGAAALVSKVEVKLDRSSAPADGLGIVRVSIKLLDASGSMLRGEIPVLLETSRGRILAAGQSISALETAIDRDRTAVGVQALVVNGELTVDVVAPTEPGEAIVRITAGAIQQSAVIDFVPHVRELIAVGLVEGIINIGKKRSALEPVRPGDGFEQEIRRFTREFSGGDGVVGVRGAFFVKGRIKGETLLTAAYDSDKDVRGRMFRDIRSEDYYPVYGDSSLRGYDAQTSGRFYVRVDNGKNYVLYGDFNSVEGQTDDAVQLSRYNRSLTGVKGQWNEGPLKATAFLSRDHLRLVVDEIAGRGISGPYSTSNGRGVQNTEKVELIVRDRNAPNIILRVVPQVRFVDYDFEPFSGRLLFKAPIASLDESLNPISIRVAYEVDEGGPKYWVGGVEASVKLGSNARIGVNLAKDDNPLGGYKLFGVNATTALGQGTQLQVEVARSDRESTVQFGSNSLVSLNNQLSNPNAVTALAASGTAWRAELRHQSEGLDGRVYAQWIDTDFSNPSASLVSGWMEAGGKFTFGLRPNLRLVGEAVSSKNLVNNGTKKGYSVGLSWDAFANTTIELGLRSAEQSGAGASISSTAFPSSGVDALTGGSTLSGTSLSGTSGFSNQINAPYETTSLRLKATYRPSATTSVFVEAEQDLKDSSAHAAAIGGDYRFSEVGRVYARSEWSSGLSGTYGLAGSGRQSATLLGIDAQYMKDGNVFSEYRLRDALAGREAVAAIGLRNYWQVAQGLRVSTTLERVHVIDGPSSPTAKAISLGADYTANPLWKTAGRVEWRDDNSSTSWLSTLGIARKLNADWTVLARNYYFNQDFDNGDLSKQNRLQLGFALRQTATNVRNALGRYEHRSERSISGGVLQTKSNTHILSFDADYHPHRSVWYSGKVAGKWSKEVLAGDVQSNFNAQLIQGRVVYDITNRWDLSAIVSALGDSGFKNRKLGTAIEVGRVLDSNLILGIGYSFKDLKDKDLMTDYSTKGVFIRLRWKFDENLFSKGSKGIDKTVDPTR
jgi:large repetitive protein